MRYLTAEAGTRQSPLPGQPQKPVHRLPPPCEIASELAAGAVLAASRFAGVAEVVGPDPLLAGPAWAALVVQLL
jgi:hypothetical protein